MQKLPHLLAVSMAVASATLAFAENQADRPGPRRGPGMRGEPIVRVLDADKDGKLSAEEIANASANLGKLDADADGNISTDELRPPRPADAPPPPEGAMPPEGRRGRPQSPVMLALDANVDHALSATEIANATASLKALDANADGQLTRDELHPLPPEDGNREGRAPRKGKRPPQE